MSVENENRNCNCQNNNMPMNNMHNMNDNSDNTMPVALNNNWMMDDMCDCNSDNLTREEMLKQIKCLGFAVIELGEYLDTHPDDEKALCLHNKYSKEYKDITDKYQKVYGPLTIFYPCNKWRWLEEPWPWEGGMN